MMLFLKITKTGYMLENVITHSTAKQFGLTKKMERNGSKWAVTLNVTSVKCYSHTSE